MSAGPEGPGWFRAPDGRWYPPAPGIGGPPGHPPGPPHAPPPPGPPFGHAPYGQQPFGPGYGAPPPPGFPPPGFGHGAAPPPGRGSGKAVGIVVAVVAGVVLFAAFGLYWVFSSVTGAVVGNSGTDCAAVATADVNAVLGGTYDVVQLGGSIGGLTAPVLDSRVLPDAGVTCWAVESGTEAGRLARIARYEGADAGRRFVAERIKAMGTTEDRGGGISVSTDEYFNKDVRAGDEAFCTSGDFLGSAGVLVRRGDVLVYVSTTAAGAGAGSIPDIQIPSDPSPNAGITFGTDDANCDLAVKLAAKVS